MARKESGGSLRARLRDMPLRYRLSIPFFFLAFFGTFSLVTLAILSQNALIHEEECDRLYSYYRALDHNVKLEGRWAVSLASSFARNPEVAEALARQDRLRLIELCYPSYLFMKKYYGIVQFNFHILPPRNFVRLQRLYEFGDDLHYRQTIQDTISTGKEVFGLEEGLTGYGIRGVSPIFHEGRMVGTVEIGFSFGSVFLQDMSRQFSIEASFLYPEGGGTQFRSTATTLPEPVVRADPVYSQVFQTRNPQLLIRDIADQPYAVLVGAVEDYKGKVFTLVEFCLKRSDTLTLIQRYRQVMLGLGILGMLLSVGAIYLISSYFMRPIARMVAFARAIATGGRRQRLDIRPSGELGVLAEALDEMLGSLERSRVQIQEYTENLEQMVHQRTRALRESEEKYRTLVENVPLVVYRLLGSGKTIFINHYVEELTGIAAQEIRDDEEFWKEKVWHEDRPRVWPMMELCLKEGREFKAEYRIAHVSGRLIHVLDQAMPVFDERGNVETVDGFLLNVTDRHQLQRQVIQTEALRTLSEVSARLAHEIRNPVVAAGGFARRLLQDLPEDDSRREKARIVLQEVARLEKILEKTLAYLKPFEIVPERSSLNDFVLRVLEEWQETLQERGVGIEVHLAASLSPVCLDQVLFRQVLGSLMEALLNVCEGGTGLEVRTYPGESAVHLEIVASGVHVSEDDIEHFFFPFTTHVEKSEALDLPLAKMIIHKHQGLIHLQRKETGQLVLSISLPH